MVPGLEEVTSQNICSWIEGDNRELTMDDEEMTSFVAQRVENESDSTSSEDEVPQSVTHAEAFLALEKSLQYVEQFDATASEIAVLRKWRNHAALLRLSVPTQKKITNFFK